MASGIRSADHVQRHVDSSAIRMRENPFHEILFPIIDRQHGACAHARPAFVGRACRGNCVRAEGSRQLDRCGADAARTALDKHRFSRLEFGLLEEREPDREKILRQCSRVDKIEPIRNPHAQERGRNAILGIAAADKQRAYAISGFDVSHIVRNRDDNAGDFQAERCTDLQAG